MSLISQSQTLQHPANNIPTTIAITRTSARAGCGVHDATATTATRHIKELLPSDRRGTRPATRKNRKRHRCPLALVRALPCVLPSVLPAGPPTGPARSFSPPSLPPSLPSPAVRQCGRNGSVGGGGEDRRKQQREGRRCVKSRVWPCAEACLVQSDSRPTPTQPQCADPQNLHSCGLHCPATP